MDADALGCDCDIEAVGKQRNGRPRYWCKAHQASATGKYGRRLERCEGAYRVLDESKSYNIDPGDFPGGFALWGAVQPVYDTTGQRCEEGVHVHARREVGGDKLIDRTFPSVGLQIAANLFDKRKAYVTKETAVASYISRFLGRPMMSLFCTYCGEPHLDSDWFAVKQHKRHLCHACGKIFLANEKCVSNPLERLRHMLGDHDEKRSLKRATIRLEVNQNEFPGGIQLWASNPALLWTAPKPEEEGIHFHGYAADGQERLEDGTFGEVIIDGISIDENQLRYFMAQKSLEYLSGKIVHLRCRCGQSYFDQGDEAFRPHAQHRCKGCGEPLSSISGRKKVVSNPFLGTIEELKRRATLLHD